MHVIARPRLLEFASRHPDAKGMIDAWWAEAKRASWKSPRDVLERHRTADILAGNRVVFNIKGNHYRLVAEINYNTGTVFIRFVGTHAEYDKIDAETIR